MEYKRSGKNHHKAKSLGATAKNYAINGHQSPKL